MSLVLAAMSLAERGKTGLVLRLRWLTVHKFRNVVSGTTLRFHDQTNVLLGKNGTGKTTLLELMASVLRFDFMWLAGEDFNIEYELTHAAPPAMSCVLHARFEGHAATDDHGVGAGFMASPDARSRGRQAAHITLSVGGQESYVLDARDNRIRVEHCGGQQREVPGESIINAGLLGALSVLGGSDTAAAASGIGAMIRAFVTSWTHFRRFDESLACFGELIGQTSSPDASHRWPTQVHLSSSAQPIPISLFASDPLIREAAKALALTPGTSAITLEHTQLPFLARTIELTGHDAARLVLSLLEQKTDPDGTMYSDFGDARLYFDRRHGRATITHQHLSYGQKRLLALLFYLEANPFNIVADELVNGMHHDWLEALMPEILGRQAFLSSQNPLLLDYLEFESCEHVQSSFILCSLDQDERMVWRNMSEPEAQVFFEAYEAGIQHVSEILRDRGLW